MSKTKLAALAVLAVVVLAGTAAPAIAKSGRDPRTHTVRIEDDCDPATFGQAGIPCVGDGDTTVDELVEELLDDGEHGKWRNEPDHLGVEHGDTLRATNTGGEAHTFTPVVAFGGGCVPELNALLGLSPVPECADPAAFPATIQLPGQSRAVGALPHGTHRFQCLIHPWMHTTVAVERR